MSAVDHDSLVQMWHPVTYVLVDQDDANILALCCEGVERGFDGRSFGLVVNDKEVLLRIGRVRHMLIKRK